MYYFHIYDENPETGEIDNHQYLSYTRDITNILEYIKNMFEVVVVSKKPFNSIHKQINDEEHRKSLYNLLHNKIEVLGGIILTEEIKKQWDNYSLPQLEEILLLR